MNRTAREIQAKLPEKNPTAQLSNETGHHKGWKVSITTFSDRLLSVLYSLGTGTEQNGTDKLRKKHFF